MRAYYRTSRRTGVSVGPVGILILAPLYVAGMLMVAAFWVSAVLIAAVLKLILLIAQRDRPTRTALPLRKAPTAHKKKSRITGLTDAAFDGIDTPTLRAWMRFWLSDRCIEEAARTGIVPKDEAKRLENEILERSNPRAVKTLSVEVDGTR